MDEVLARNALNAMLRATDDDATPIIRRLARVQARAALDTLASAPAYPSLELCVQFSDDGRHIRKWSRLPFDGGTDFYSHPASAPAGDDVEDAARRMYEDRPYKIDSEYQAQVTGLPMGDAVTWDDLKKAGYDLSEWYRLARAALARPRAAVGEQSREVVELVHDRHKFAAAPAVGKHNRGVIARIIDPDAFGDYAGRCEREIGNTMWPARRDSAYTKADAILALQSPPAKVEW